jgi:hypothetical protein
MKAYLISQLNETIQIENTVYCFLTQDICHAKPLTETEMSGLECVDVKNNSVISAIKAHKELIKKSIKKDYREDRMYVNYLPIISVIFFTFFLFSSCTNSTDKLIKELNSNNADKRLHAATMLVQEKKSDTVKKLIPLLKSKDERLVFITTEILGKMDDSTAVNPLGDVISHSNPNIRKAAASSLGLIGNSSSWTYLVGALIDSDPGVRHDAVVALGKINYPQGIKFIHTMFRDKVDSVRAVAVNALYQYRTLPEPWVKAENFAVPLKDESELVRYVAAQALGYAYTDSVIAGDLLIEALNDQSKTVRVEAIKSINKPRYSKAVPVLKKMYDKATVDEENQITEAIKYIEMYPKKWPAE